MTSTTTIGALVILDHFLRRWILPLSLLAASLLRYNLFSFAYLIFFLVSVILAGPRLKSQRVICVVFLFIVVVAAALFTLTQLGFQIAIATGFKLEPCETLEVVLRQIGLILFTVPPVDIVRHIVPDIVILLVSSVTVGVAIKIALLHGEDDTPASEAQTPEQHTIEVKETPLTEATSLSHSHQPAHQEFNKLPSWLLLVYDILIFFLLLLCGVAVPSLTSLFYFSFFLLLSLLWSFHLQHLFVIRWLRCLALIYSSLHILILYLYQLQSAQLLIPISPKDTTSSLLARLFGLTPIIETTCSRPTELLVWEATPTTFLINPWALIGLYWILGIDCQLWLTTPKSLSVKYKTYFLPALKYMGDVGRAELEPPLSSVRYGAIEATPTVITETSLSDEGPQEETTSDTEDDRKSVIRKYGREKLIHLWNMFSMRVMEIWSIIMSVNYIFAIIAMMVWSVIYPSWLALVLLLWASAIWLIPRISPKQSFYWTSPILLLYSLSLLLLQYSHSLNLTSSELSWNLAFGTECVSRSSPNLENCRSAVVGIKSLLMLVFCASVREFVKDLKANRSRQNGGRDQTDQGDDNRDQPLLGVVEEATDTETSNTTTTMLYMELKLLLTSYWILVVVLAFVLVILTGEPSILKSVYLIFFFIFLFLYQISKSWWQYLNYPLWMILVAYATLHLILVYTFPFSTINTLWMKAYESSDIMSSRNISSTDLYESIGFVDYNDLGTGPRSVFAILVPLAIFIAVLALQLRYFTPKPHPQQTQESGLSIGHVLTRFANAVSIVDIDFKQLENEIEDQKTVSAINEDSLVIKEKSKTLTLYRIIMYLLVKVRQFLVNLWHLFWRFSELHTHKFAIICLFAVSIYEISISYVPVILFILIATPLPILNWIGYPIMTIYLGMLSLGKFLFQLPLINDFMFGNGCDNTIEDVSNLKGQIFNYSFSPSNNDNSWIGLNKASHNPHGYIAGPMLVSLLFCFWYSAKRHQGYYYRSRGIIIERENVGSLFLSTDSERVHTSWIEAVKFLINHVFEMYGVEICWIMQAILIAARIDVYGVLYGVLLLAMLVIPRRFLSYSWIVFIVVHGSLLVIQYLMLLGLPPSVLCEKDYPWDKTFPISSYGIQLERWLYVPHEGADILDKWILYADLISYILLCLQLRYFLRNPLNYIRGRDSVLPNMYDTNYWIDYIKIIIFQYFFWFALFIVFVTGAIRMSIFGLIYLVLCFWFLYRGSNLLTDPRKTRIKWWTILRYVTYIILFLRILIQIMGCIFEEQVRNATSCLFIGLFNIRCARSSYYGISPSVECDNGSETNTGLWFDVFSFAVITVQILLMDTTYADQVQNEIVKKEDDAVNFAEIMKEVLKDKQLITQREHEHNLMELEKRAEQLEVTEGKIAHLLHAGTRIPPEYISKSPVKTRVSTSISPSPTHLDEDTPTEGEDPFVVVDDEAAKIETEPSKLKRAGQFLWGVWVEVVDYIIQWFEINSANYIEVVKRLKRARYQSAKDMLLTSTMPPLEEKATPTSDHVSSDEQTKEEEVLRKKEKRSSHRLTGASPHFDQTSDNLITALRVLPSDLEEEEAHEVGSTLQRVTSQYSERPKRFLYALYYWFLSHFEYVVFFFVILTILRTGSLISFVYAAIVFLWGLLSIPWPSKRFWLALLFFTMLVLVSKYVYLFFLVTHFGRDTQYHSLEPGIETGDLLSWMFGIQSENSYFVNAVFNLLLLMSIIFHRGLLKQHGLWQSSSSIRKEGVSIFKDSFKSIYHFFKTLINPGIVVGNKDYYTMILTCDVLCFITIVLGYSQFTVTTGNNDFVDAAKFIQTNNVPLTFVIMLLLQFISMLVDRAIYLRHSIRAKLIFYILLLILWHIVLLIILPLVTTKAFVDNPAAQLIYFFKSGYFVLSALQMISGYPVRLLKYFVGSSYSTVVGLIFMGYRLIPLIPELREVMDWIFTNTSLTLINWLRVQEIWAQLYQIKVRRAREKSFPRDLGAEQSFVIKFLMGGALLVLLVLLIWGPLLAVSLVNEVSLSNPPISASVQLHLEGYQLLEIRAQSSLIYQLTSEQYQELQNKITQTSINRDFRSLFPKDDFRRVTFPGNSSLLWTVSTTSAEQLSSLLKNVKSNNLLNANMIFSWSLTRSPSTGLVSSTVTGSVTKKLNESNSSLILQQFIDNINGNNSVPIILNELYPVFIFAPANEQSTEFKELSNLIGNSSADCTAQLNQTILDNITINQWWTILQTSSIFVQKENNDLEMIIFSERIAPPIFSYITSFGIIGLYVSVVLVISRFVRSYINSLPLNLLVEEIPYPDPLLKLCDDIFTVREVKNFVMEEILVGRLIYIFRSPQRLLQLTERPKTKSD